MTSQGPGPETVENLLPGLTSPDKDIRQRAALRLGTLADPAAAPALVTRLGEESDPFARETISWALVQLGESARPLVEEQAQTGDAHVRLHALHVLSKIADPASVPAIRERTTDTDAGVAAKARFALSRIGDAESLPYLTRHLGQGDMGQRQQLTRDLASFGEPAVEEAIAALSSAEPGVRRHAADVLAHLGEGAAGAVPALTEALEDQDPEVRLTATMALREIGATEALEQARENEDPRVRMVALRER